MFIELTTADSLRRNWAYITENNLIPQLIEEGIIELTFEAAINANVVWRLYDGRVDIKAVYRAFDEIIADASQYLTVNLTPELVHQVAGLAIAQQPEIAAALITLNGGTMPNIRPPYIPPVTEPVDENAA